MKNWKIILSLILITNISGQIFAQDKKEMTSVAYNDCGNANNQPFLVLGENYIFENKALGNRTERTCNFGNKIIYAFDKVNINANYRLRMVFTSDDIREISLSADGNQLGGIIKLSKNEKKEVQLVLPKKAYAYGQLVLIFDLIKGANAVVSELELVSSDATLLVPFNKERKNELIKSSTIVVTEKIEIEKVLPQYTPRPKKVSGVFNPVLTLNGVWNFNEKPQEDFFTKNTVSKNWKSINVPGEWAMQGYKVDSAAFAGYEKKFYIPKNWKNKRIIIRFDGVSSESNIWVNGQNIGSHMGGMTAFEFDITKNIKTGENRISLKVRNESLADMMGSLTQYAAHQIGGITRKVTLFTVPDVHLTHLQMETDLDNSYHNAILKVKMKITNKSNETTNNMSVRFTLPGENLVKEFQVDNIKPNGTITKEIEIFVKNPKKWTNETPNLYQLYTDLLIDKSLSERIVRKIGFREVEVRGSELLVNGVSVKLRGVNRHEVHPLTGRVLSKEMWEKDVDLYLKANCNFIRTSHYPPTEEFIETCDEKGIFVEVESPVCWVGHHANKNWLKLNYKDEKYFPYMLQANMETIQFYRNHPSVIFWSAANESYWNLNTARLMEYVKAADLTRPSAFHDQAYGGFNNQGSNATIANIHYPGPNGYKKATEINRPLFYGEYCHLNVYNRRELITDPSVRNDWAMALAPTWENMYKTKGILGGAIWSGIDDVFQMPDGDAVGYGPWGPIDGWRRAKPEYWHVKKIYSPIRVLTKELETGKIFKIQIENRYTFENLEKGKLVWEFAGETGLIFPVIAPGKTGEVIINVGKSVANKKLKLSFFDLKDYLVDEFIIPVGKQTFTEVISDIPSISTKLKTTKNEFIIKGDNFACRIDRKTGQIITLKKNGVVILNGGPWLMALPLDGEGCEPDHDANIPPFNNLCGNWKANSVKAKKEGKDVVISVIGSYYNFIGDYRLRINANGNVKLDYIFANKIAVNPRQWGMVFDSPKSFNELFWDRKGRWSSYPSKHIGRTHGTTPLFYDGVPEKINPREEPLWNWSMDFNKLGSNDFRSTRRNFNYAGLRNNKGQQVMAVSKDASQHWRSWLDGDKIQFLIAKFATAGNELFLDSYYAPTRRPIKVGDKISDTIELQIK